MDTFQHGNYLVGKETPKSKLDRIRSSVMRLVRFRDREDSTLSAFGQSVFVKERDKDI